MRDITPEGVRARALKGALALSCEKVARARQGKQTPGNDAKILELMLIHEFSHYWNATQLRQKECYLKDKFNV